MIFLFLSKFWLSFFTIDLFYLFIFFSFHQSCDLFSLINRFIINILLWYLIFCFIVNKFELLSCDKCIFKICSFTHLSHLIKSLLIKLFMEVFSFRLNFSILYILRNAWMFMNFRCIISIKLKSWSWSTVQNIICCLILLVRLLSLSMRKRSNIKSLVEWKVLYWGHMWS